MADNIHKVTINCTGQALGRVSTQVAVLLMGKNLPEFRPNIDIPTFVTLENYKEIIFTGKKMKQKMYYNHSGYIGGLRTRTLEEIWRDDPTEVIKHSVLGMLPKNKLQNNRIKRLKFDGK